MDSVEGQASRSGERYLSFIRASRSAFDQAKGEKLLELSITYLQFKTERFWA
jgi:hypothetical protein